MSIITILIGILFLCCFVHTIEIVQDMSEAENMVAYMDMSVETTKYNARVYSDDMFKRMRQLQAILQAVENCCNTEIHILQNIREAEDLQGKQESQQGKWEL